MIATLTVEGAIEDFAHYCIANLNLRPGTVKTYVAALHDFRRVMPEADLLTAERATLVRYLDRLYLHKKLVSTRNTRLGGLKAFFRWMKESGHRDDNPAAGVRRLRETLGAPPHFSEEELDLIVFGVELPQAGIVRGRKEQDGFFRHRLAVSMIVEQRDTALLGLVYGAGLRVAEPALLHRDQYDEKTGRITLVGGKWATEPQALYVKIPAVLDAMRVYLDLLWRSPWANHPALFPPFTDHPRTHEGPGISADAVTRILEKRIERTGIEARGRRLSPHTIRYSIGSHMHDARMSDLEIAEHLRHKSMDTVRRYVNLGGSAKLAGRVAFALRSFGRGRVREQSA
ncbi:MAG: tyrosine-type recombinase/integrase [Acidobacteriota bacterium]|nr:tyrosine-type recombinase/integrase [Acidobacteriota bacterium]